MNKKRNRSELIFKNYLNGIALTKEDELVGMKLFNGRLNRILRNKL